MSELTIVCDNCGAKYRLPASFSGDKAKCKQCGSVIDVAAQKASAAAPKPAAKAAPAAAAPATSARQGRAGRSADKPERSAKAGKDESRSRRGKKEGDDAGSGRGERAPKKNNTMLLAGGGIGALAIVAVIVALSFKGKTPPAPATTDQARVEKPVEKPVAKPEEPAKPTPAAPEASKDPAVAPAPAKEPTADAKPAEAKTADAATSTTEKTPADAPAAGSTGKVSDRNKTTSMADVFDPSTLGEVTWPDDVTDEKKTEIRGLMEDILNGGRAGITAKPKVAQLGYPAIFGLVEQLRKLDYKTSDGLMTAFELNKLLQEICAGMNTGFEPVNYGDEVLPRVADHNAKTNKAWAQLLIKFPSQGAFDEWKKARLADKPAK